jgi:hypothetical protein
MLGKAERQMRAPLALLAQGFEARSFVKLNAGLERVDGETDRSEPSAEVAVEIEKTQMQARRRRNPNAFQLHASLHDPPAFASCDFLATLRNFARFAKRRRSSRAR